MLLPDVNVWLALTFDSHIHHPGVATSLTGHVSILFGKDASMKTLVTFVLVLAPMTVTTAGTEDKGLDPDSLVGTWSFESGAKAGLTFPGEGLSGTWTVTKETFTLKARDGRTVWFIKYKLDTTKSPV